MAEKMKSTTKRPPQSLNDSHYRFLLDLSAPPKPKPSDEDFEDSEDEKSQWKVKIEDRRGECEAVDKDSSFEDDNVPSFSVFGEFDSPPEQEKLTKVKIEGRRRLCKLSSQVDQENPEKIEVSDEPTFSEQEKPAKVKIEGRHGLCKLSSQVDQENLEKREVSDEPTFSEQEKPAKVKIEGRRRLCKLSSQVDQENLEKREVSDEPTFLGQEKPAKVKIEGRRRLCKLSSHVDEENPEKRAVPDESTVADATDFESPLPTTPPPQDVNGSDKNGGDNEIRNILNDLSAKLEFLSIEKRKGINNTRPVESSLPMFRYKEIEEEKKVDLLEYASAESSFSLASDASDSSSDATKNGKSFTEIADCEDPKDRDLHYIHESEISSRADHRNVGDNFMSKHSFVSHVKEVKDNNQNGQKGDNQVGRVYGATKHYEYKKSEVSKSDMKLVNLGKSSVYRFEEREDSDEDDCVVASGNKFANKVGRQGVKFKEHDVFNDADILEEDSSVTLCSARYIYKLQGAIAKMLYPHQREGLKWLWALHCQGKGGILGDDMGLGKTMQICGFLAGLFHSRLIKRAMIVAPKTLLPHWIKELSVVGLSDKTREYFGTCAKAREYELQYVLQDKGILLTTYDIVRLNSKSLWGDKYNYFDDDESEDNVTWDYMILDEGHLIKNPSTQRYKSLLEIPSAHRIIISGTPIQNNLKELWALFNFCCPDLLGDKQRFKEIFEDAILRGNEKNATEREKRIGSEAAKKLRECIQPYFLRRLKNEVFNEESEQKSTKLSKKNEMIVWLRLTSCQRQIYEAYLNSELVLSAFDGSPLAALTILKKICDHPLLLTKRAAEDVLEEMDTTLKPEEINMAEKLAMYIADSAETDRFEENHVNISCKISFIMSLLEDLIPKGHSVLIFSQTRKMLNLIQDSLESNDYGYLRIDGTTKPSDRLKIVNDFQNGIGAPIFLLTSLVGGLGLTLTRADRVIVVDPAWNPSTDNQSVDRAYRIGQTKDVLVYRLMTCGTVEEKIYRKQIFKGGLFRTATEHKEQTRYFSQQDLRELFSLPKQGFDVSPTQQQLHEEHDRQHIVDDDLKAHIKFLESLGIAGVSHHSLLFSKAAPVQEGQGEEELTRKPAATFVGASASSVAVERSVDGAEYAFKPKDININMKISSPDSGGKLTESDIKEKIDRLSKTLANKAMISKLPDNGNKIQIQIAELSAELNRIKVDKENKKEVIDLDSLTGEFRKALNV